ncbi:hypothetical protein ACHAXR_002019 [Thalassiosira sp. AJA248-18]
MNNQHNHHRNAYNALNIYSVTAQNRFRYRLIPSKRSMILSFCCFAIVIYEIPRLFGPPTTTTTKQGKFGRRRHSREKKQHRCWLKHALESGEFKLFSHRSYYDNTQSDKERSATTTSCKDALVQLKHINVNHLDLDLVLGDLQQQHSHGEKNNQQQLIVAHPMEFKGQSKYYSPCANTDFDEMIQTLKHVYAGNDFFISMEPKAAWGNTQKELDDVALTNSPSTILEELLKKIIQHELGGHCAVIAEINEVAQQHDNGQELEKERSLLKDISQHCQLFRGIRLLDDSPTSIGDGYAMIMPTIEFHPSHAHNTAGKVIPQSLWSKSISWVVDNEEDLDLAAELRPFGIVSNSPKNIVDIVKGSSWCGE